MSIIYTGNTTQNIQTSTNGTSSKSVLGKDDFMKLLVAQMSNQDPLNPTEGTELSAQLAQFGSLEQMQNINDTLKQNLDANYLLATSINNTMSATVIGKNVKAYGNGIEYVSGQDTKICFELNANAQEVKTEILDENGKVVRIFTDENLVAGEQSRVWDGKDDEGNEVTEGSYTYRVSAVNNSGDSISVQTYTFGAISGIRFSSTGALLMLGNLEVKMSDVYEIVNN